MTDERPPWADALANTLAALAKQAPRPLLSTVSLFAGITVDEPMLISYLRTIDPNDPALTQLRLALAVWDQTDFAAWLESAPAEARPPRSLDRRAWVGGQLGLGPDAVDVISERAPVYQDRPVVISTVFEPWYRLARPQRSQMYWTDYVDHLVSIDWPTESIATLDETTTQIVERLSDPTRPEAKPTKGLVVGYVQSGKTANFTGVVAKAIDAGYRLVIVLTGTIEILRAQTQRRLDMELVGRENILAGLDLDDPDVVKELDYQQDEDWIADRFVTHGEGSRNRLALRESGASPPIGSDYKRLPHGLSRLKFSRLDRGKAAQ